MSGEAGCPMAVPRRVKLGGPVLRHCGRQPEALGLAAVGPHGLGVRRGPWWGRWARARARLRFKQFSLGGLGLGWVAVKAVPARMSACSLRGRAIRSWHKGQCQDFGAVLASGWAIQAPLCGLTLLAST